MFIFSMIILIFFAIIGLCAFITALVDLSCRHNSEILIVLRDLSAESAEARIRSAARLCMRRTEARLLCVCKEEDPAAEICRLMKKEYPFLTIVSRVDFCESAS